MILVIKEAHTRDRPDDQSEVGWGVCGGVLVLPGKGLTEAEELISNWPGGEVAGERAFQAEGLECAKSSVHERARCVPGSEGSRGWDGENGTG